jgi:Transposase IS66 family
MMQMASALVNWDLEVGGGPRAVRHRSRDVLIRVLGESFAGTLVSDFYAAYNGLDCAKARCLVHLLRELANLRDELPWQSVRAFIQPLIDLFRDAIQSGKGRE